MEIFIYFIVLKFIGIFYFLVEGVLKNSRREIK
jgi:hypothetical protein